MADNGNNPIRKETALECNSRLYIDSGFEMCHDSLTSTGIEVQLKQTGWSGREKAILSLTALKLRPRP